MTNQTYVPGVSIGYKDVFGRDCPAVIVDGDSVFCLFPGSYGSEEAVKLAALLNHIEQWDDGKHGKTDKGVYIRG